MAKKIVHLTFPDELVQEPIVYRLGHEFKVVTNIFRAAVGETDAWLILELEGAEKEILRSLEFLRNLKIRAEELSDFEI
jgi:ABC-type methionine transport system ATPase subunit